MVVAILGVTLAAGSARADTVGLTSLSAPAGCPGDTVEANLTLFFDGNDSAGQLVDGATVEVTITQADAAAAGFVVAQPYQPTGTVTLPANYRDPATGRIVFPTTVSVTIPTTAAPGPYSFTGGVKIQGPMLDRDEPFNVFGGSLRLIGSVLDCTDTDGDGVYDVEDNCPTVANSDQADFDGDGQGDICDPDDDNDGVADGDDAFPFDPSESSDNDGDGVGDNADPDDDNDGQTDADESACGSDPLDAASTSPDNDGDDIPDCVDPDDDNDGVADGDDLCPDTQADPAPERLKENRYWPDPSGTFGCSGSQIIDDVGLGKGHTKFGISKGALADWMAGVS